MRPLDKWMPLDAAGTTECQPLRLSVATATGLSLSLVLPLLLLLLLLLLLCAAGFAVAVLAAAPVANLLTPMFLHAGPPSCAMALTFTKSHLKIAGSSCTSDVISVFLRLHSALTAGSQCHLNSCS